MRLADCEVTHRHIRGHNVAFLFGPRGISDAEATALAEEWSHTYGPVRLPAYVSPDGWRTLYPVDGAGPVASLLRVDEHREVIEFDGVKFSAELLRTFTEPTPENFAFRIVGVDDVATVIRIELPAVQEVEQRAGDANAAGSPPTPDGAGAPAVADEAKPAKTPTQSRKKAGA